MSLLSISPQLNNIELSSLEINLFQAALKILTLSRDMNQTLHRRIFKNHEIRFHL